MGKRDSFAKSLKQLTEENCIYLDEAGMDDTLFYSYGWSKRGTRCFSERLGNATQRVSMIAVWCQKRVIAPMLFHGYCTSMVVETYFKQVLMPKLSRGQTIILDNASFHRKSKLSALLEPLGCYLLPLLPYSPDLNKIEHLWHTIKSLVCHDLDDSLPLIDKLDHTFCSL